MHEDEGGRRRAARDTMGADTRSNRPLRTRVATDIYQAGTKTGVKKPGRGQKPETALF